MNLWHLKSYFYAFYDSKFHLNVLFILRFWKNSLPRCQWLSSKNMSSCEINSKELQNNVWVFSCCFKINYEPIIENESLSFVFRSISFSLANDELDSCCNNKGWWVFFNTNIISCRKKLVGKWGALISCSSFEGISTR